MDLQEKKETQILTGKLMGLIDACLFLLEMEELDLAKLVFSDNLGKNFPKKLTNLNKINFDAVFKRHLSDSFKEAFLQMVSLWITIQDDRSPFEADREKLDKKSFLLQLRLSKKRLGEARSSVNELGV